MSFRAWWMGALFSLVFLGGQARADSAAEDDKHYPIVTLFDADVPASERQATFEYFNKKAIEGNTFAQYLIGSLYRIGNRLPGNIVPLDLDKANKYLSTAAGHGSLRAMAKMAELELSQKRYLEAMIWAQLFGYYAGLNSADAKAIKDSPQADYLADLIRRISDRFDNAQMPVVKEDMNAVIAARDADIRQGMAQGAGTFSSTRDRLEYRTSTRRKFADPPRPAEYKDVMADYLVAFDAKGDAAQAWLIDALPDVALGRSLEVVALNLQVNEAPAGTDLRWAVAPINFSWGRSKLLPAK